jgi:hypothetical protein
MCDVRDKLILFDHAISEFAELTSKEKGISFNGALAEFSTTRIMKLVYLISLDCIDTENDKSYKDTLFSKLDRWNAYKNGPVEEDVYWSLSFLPTIKKTFSEPYKERRAEKEDYNEIFKFYGITTPPADLNSKNVRDFLIEKRGLREDIKKISSAIKKDAEAEKGRKLLSYSVDKLIRISHSGVLWVAGRYEDDLRMDPKNIYRLREEKRAIEEAKTYV